MKWLWLYHFPPASSIDLSPATTMSIREDVSWQQQSYMFEHKYHTFHRCVPVGRWILPPAIHVWPLWGIFGIDTYFSDTHILKPCCQRFQSILKTCWSHLWNVDRHLPKDFSPSQFNRYPFYCAPFVLWYSKVAPQLEAIPTTNHPRKFQAAQDDADAEEKPLTKHQEISREASLEIFICEMGMSMNTLGNWTHINSLINQFNLFQ